MSLSWSGGTSSNESHLVHPGVAIFAGAGDSGYGTAYPAGSTSPPPPKCNGVGKPTSFCSAGWRCCGTWHCGVSE